jgi:hypothetical protein
VVVDVGPALGNLEAGAVGSLVGVSFSIVSGGLACIAGAVALAAALPQFRRYDAAAPTPAQEDTPGQGPSEEGESNPGLWP